MSDDLGLPIRPVKEAFTYQVLEVPSPIKDTDNSK
jgi:hypothetical protein